MTDLMIPHLDFIYLQSELAEKSSAILKSKQYIANSAKLCFEDTGKYIAPED